MVVQCQNNPLSDSAAKPHHSNFQVPSALNPASLLPDPDLEVPLHDCFRNLTQAHSIRSDLQDTPLPDADIIWYTDSSSFMQYSRRYAGAAVTTKEEVIWTELLMPTGSSAQWAELIALTKALGLGKG